jgi:hypothetical protein
MVGGRPAEAILVSMGSVTGSEKILGIVRIKCVFPMKHFG